ncbi:adenine nucleotide alpha hydrolases-like protein [Backusella circina FSU 941]|nr:adenine nucleotide alpha hydrolases-like protein [Backusella circina FSU 941]
MTQCEAPLVLLNGTSMMEHPLTTEEPILSAELKMEVAKLNQVDPVDKEIPPAIIIEQTDPNKIPDQVIVGTPSLVDDDGLHLPASPPPEIITSPPPTETSPNEEDKDKKEEEVFDEWEWDEELETNTETNRWIPFEQETPTLETKKALRNLSYDERQDILVFAEQNDVTASTKRIKVSTVYGAGPKGALDPDLIPARKSRSYLVAFDFSEESKLALEWALGTMMRDGDTLHVVTVINREDNPNTVKKAGLSLSNELNKASNALVAETTRVLGQMLLYDIKAHIFTICGRVKDVLSSLIDELQLTMVVCGNNGRGTVKGMLMGSISTYLVHKSSVPVTVIRPQKKKEKPQKKKPIYVAPLSHSVQTGQLAVDELHTPTKN